MIDIQQINNQPYLIQLIKSVNKSDTPILDISGLSADNKAKVISAYTKFKFSLDSSGTLIRASLLTDRITTEEKPKRVSLSLEDTPIVITDKIVEEAPTKKKKKDD